MGAATGVPAPRNHDASLLERLREEALALSVGERLPAERALAESYGVARMTVRQAIASLAREGLVRTVHGSGTVRVPDPMRLRVGLGSFAEAVRAAGMTPSSTVLALGVDATPPDVARSFLGSDPSHPLIVVRRVRFGDSVPLALESAWFPATAADDLTPTIAAGSLYEHLAARGLLPDQGEEVVRADLPTPEESRLLECPASRPVLRLERRALCGTAPIEYSEAVFPSDRHELTFPLAAVGGSA